MPWKALDRPLALLTCALYTAWRTAAAVSVPLATTHTICVLLTYVLLAQATPLTDAAVVGVNQSPVSVRVRELGRPQFTPWSRTAAGRQGGQLRSWRW